LAVCLDSQGRTLDAESLYRKTLEVRERILGENHPDTVNSYNGVASNLDVSVISAPRIPEG